MKRLMTIPAGAVLAAGMMLGQTTAPATPAPQQRQWGQHRGMRMNPQQRFDRLATELNLDTQQRQNAQKIMADAKTSAEPIVAQLRQIHQQLAAAVKANDTSAINTLSANEGVLVGQLTAIRTKALAQGYAMLRPDQKAKADQLVQRFHGMGAGPMMQHRMGPGGGAPATPPSR